jgi:hypothetical protein
MPDKPENSAFKLLSSRKTLIMATADKNGMPNVSYAPFVRRASSLYVFSKFPFAPHKQYDGNGKSECHVHRRRNSNKKLFCTKALHLPVHR